MPKFLVKRPFQLKSVLRQPGEVLDLGADDAKDFVERGDLRQVDKNLKQIPLPEPKAPKASSKGGESAKKGKQDADGNGKPKGKGKGE